MIGGPPPSALRAHDRPLPGAGEAPARPLVVHDDPVRVSWAVATLATLGWTVVPIEELAPSPWSLAPTGVVVTTAVTSQTGAAAAVEAAVRGAGVVLDLAAAGPLADRVVADLRRVGVVADLRCTAAHPVERLAPLQVGILAAVAAGDALVDVAARSFVSTRTAHRRVREARDALGVATSAEAAHAVRDRLDHLGFVRR